MTVWFTSDTHFGHKNIIGFCNRPYLSTDEMDADLIKNWNMLIAPDDEVWHLGDFSFHRSDWRSDAAIVEQLHGRKHLIVGNHDNYGFQKKCKWTSVNQGIIERSFSCNGYQTHLVLAHYPLREWNGFFYGSYHLYGHVHARLKSYGRSMDVGVDTNNFMPYKLEQILTILGSKENNHSSMRIE